MSDNDKHVFCFPTKTTAINQSNNSIHSPYVPQALQQPTTSVPKAEPAVKKYQT